MTLNEGCKSLWIAITSFISWLACLLASLFKPSRPLEELPIVMSSSHQTIALLEAFHAEDQVSVPRPHSRHRRVAPNIDFPNEKGLIRSATSPTKPKTSSSSMPAARDKLLSSYPAEFRWTAPITRPEDNDWESMRGVRPLGDDDKVQIGNLGQRRGFRGNPLTVRKWSRSSSFLSLPRGLNFTPRSSSTASFDGSFPSSPRTPLEAMASRMRSVSLSVVSWSSGAKPALLEVAQDLQDLYDASDPFASPGDTFFVYMTDANTVPLHDPCKLGFYRQNRMTQKRSCIAKSVPLQAALHSAFTNARMKTTIYDISTADIVPARTSVPVIRKNVFDTLNVPENNVADGISAANSPTIVLTAPPSTTEQQADKDENVELPVKLDTPPKILGETEAPRSALAAIGNTQDLNTTPHVVSVFPVIDGGFANVQLPVFQYAEFPKVVYESSRTSAHDALVPFPGCDYTLAPYSAPKRQSSLRPLVLPARVASRGRSQGLEGIIALLDV